MKLTAGLPAWTLRAAVLAAVALIVILLLAQGLPAVPAGIISLFGVFSVLAPASHAPALVIIATAVSAVMAGGGALDIGVLVLLPLVHLVHIGSAMTAVIPGTGRIHLAALKPAAIRFVIVQAAVLGLTVVAMIVPESATPLALEAAALIGATALAVIAARLIMNRPQ